MQEVKKPTNNAPVRNVSRQWIVGGFLAFGTLLDIPKEKTEKKPRKVKYQQRCLIFFIVSV